MLDSGHAANIPFCLFFMLVRVCSRAPSSGVNGCRRKVAMVMIRHKVAKQGQMDNRGDDGGQLPSVAAKK